VELVVLTPVIILFVLITLAFGRYALAREEVVGGARAAADAVAVADSEGQTQQEAVAAAMPVLQSTHSCTDPNVTVDSGSFAPGATVLVSVSCRVELSDLVPGLPGFATVRTVESAVIDPYRTTLP
jgi:Flp pilus assembly protein TadG